MSLHSDRREIVFIARNVRLPSCAFKFPRVMWRYHYPVSMQTFFSSYLDYLLMYFNDAGVSRCLYVIYVTHRLSLVAFELNLVKRELVR